jgi:hypothetical protein
MSATLSQLVVADATQVERLRRGRRPRLVKPAR